jgi:hypothetical protein
VTAPALKPRAIAALLSLRGTPRTLIQIRNAIADVSTGATTDLLSDMRGLNLVGQIAGDDRWYLDHDGLGWLQSNGLDADRSAYLWVAQSIRRFRTT